MPGKRARKDSERSTGSNGPTTTNFTSSGPDMSSCNGAGSSSSGSVGDESENLKSCCFPAGCPFGEDALADVNSMVKVLCSYDGCKMSQFMHADCFSHWEESLLTFLRSHGRARSWSEKQRRQNLWTKKGYDLIFRACFCRCKHGHLKKDLDWVPQSSLTVSESDMATNKKKNRKKHKDLPSLGGYGSITKSKSKPIPNGKDNRMRHSSASSSVSVDQGYISASPGAAELAPSVFSPPMHHHRSLFSFHNASALGNRGCTSFHAPSTSPLLEIPDDGSTGSPQFTPSPNSNTSPVSPIDGAAFSPPLSPETDINKMTSSHPCPLPIPSGNRMEQFRSVDTSSEQKSVGSDVQAMSAYIDSLLRNRAEETAFSALSQQGYGFPRSLDSQTLQSDEMLSLQLEAMKLNRKECSSGIGSFPAVPLNSPTVPGSFLEEFRRRAALSSSWSNGMVPRVDDLTTLEHRNPGTNAQVLMALRQKEQFEIERRDMGKYLMNVVSPEEAKAQILAMSENRSRTSSHTEMRVVPMRCTNFAKRYNFSAFQEVLARQHVNPYHIKMEGEGYGSDDLRNFILASLSKEKCAQMNCVVCGVDLPVYDHFPLIDGTMFLSPEKNERSTKNCFKIKVEGKFEYVHAACIRCMEGLHNIVCRFCNNRWEGVHHQLGTLYMFDIFAAAPCCQKRLCCKHCGYVVVDIRQGLNYFSEYSSQKTCPSCKAVDFHFVHPVTTYQLMGLVFS